MQIFKKIKQIKLVLLLSSLILLNSCVNNVVVDVEAISTATKKYDSSTIKLPEESSNYEVLGVVDGLKNYVVQYNPKLYRGGEPYSENAAIELKKLEVEKILSITANEKEKSFSVNHGFQLYDITFDKNTGPSELIITKFLNTVVESKNPIYLHCYGGTHRAGILGMAQRIYIEKWKIEDAIMEYEQLGGNRIDDFDMIQKIIEYNYNGQ